MTAAFKERLKLLDVIGDKNYLIKHYLEEIPDGQKFLIVAGHIEDELEFHLYLTQLAKINGVTTSPSALGRIGSYLWEHYEVRIYEGDDRRSIGVYDKNKRVCRFCGRKMPDVSFKHKAHAISEALGNKGLVCLEECDECNKRFNESIEQDLVQMMAPHLLLHGISGKNGIPTIKGDGITMRLDTSTRSTFGQDTISFILRDMLNSRDPQKILDSINKDYDIFLRYTPQNIYKCLCKYALSLMDSSELKYFPSRAISFHRNTMASPRPAIKDGPQTKAQHPSTREMSTAAPSNQPASRAIQTGLPRCRAKRGGLSFGD